jgi:hypothetical protein
MGGLFETEKMQRHVESCAQCQAAPGYVDRCDDWHGMANNLMDWECSEGPFEDGQDKCPVCDGPLDNKGFCRRLRTSVPGYRRDRGELVRFGTWTMRHRANSTAHEQGRWRIGEANASTTGRSR